ncbi:MAG: uncharacterized protein A8A55_2017 [Amphiamblys sp. WSBS2006]|nr:MAG: uncharacterized protein A8A55_2017 [Amphiamblys sp. WSBS2006]
MRIGKGCELEQYNLSAFEERHISKVLREEDRSIATGRVKSMELLWYAVCILAKLRIHNDNTMEKFALSTNELHFSRIIEEGDSSIDVGRIRRCGFKVPEKIRQKLRYTLVDGEGKEVLRERSSSQRGNNLE